MKTTILTQYEGNNMKTTILLQYYYNITTILLQYEDKYI